MKIMGFLAESKYDKIETHGDVVHVDMSALSEIVAENIELKKRVQELESQLVVARYM